MQLNITMMRNPTATVCDTSILVS
eukprot:COSAG01_NODE_32329_length_583_cov_0.770661_1_plen_23_part_10